MIMDEFEFEELTGEIVAVVFRNEESGYTVLRVNPQDVSGYVTAVGCIPFAYPGQSIYAEGTWENNNTHGHQFKVSTASIVLPDTESSLYQYLSSGVLKGVGPATASLLINTFGRETLTVIANNPERLSEVRGISSSKARAIQKEYSRQLVINRLTEYTSLYNIRPVLALRLYRYYGASAADVLEENPYIIASSHIGGRFSEADNLALSMGIDGFSDNRIKAAIVFELNYNSGNGHCFIPREKLCAATSQLINVDSSDVDRCIESLLEDGQIIMERVANCNACYLPRLYEAESDSAARIAQMVSQQYPVYLNLNSFLNEVEKRENLKLSELQKKAVILSAENRVVIITGGPGTGKTTSIRTVLALFDKAGLNTLLAAPTGRAAKRMSEVTGYDAYTVHRLLGAKIGEDDETVVFEKNESDPLECDALILDECSMIDIVLFNAVLNAIPKNARLILVGDADQLPSVGPGNVFSSLIRSNVIPTVRLNEIFRQGDGSSIVKNAHLINSGEHPDFSDNRVDFFRLKRPDSEIALTTISELCSTRLPKKMGIRSEDIQVLSPTRKGTLGTINLNQTLQSVINPASPDKKEKVFGEHVFREGDRIMQIKNNYDILWEQSATGLKGSGIFNGDMGIISKIDEINGCLVIDFDGKTVYYSYDYLTELEHAWAVTVHKSQGNEYRAVVLALSDHSSLLMTRDILYTAVSRAKQILIMVGDESIAHKMIDNSKQTKRYCALKHRLIALCVQ